VALAARHAKDGALDREIAGRLEAISDTRTEIARERAVHARLKEDIESTRRGQDGAGLRESAKTLGVALSQDEWRLCTMRVIARFRDRCIRTMMHRVQEAKLCTLKIQNMRREIADMKGGKKHITYPAELSFLGSEQMNRQRVLDGLLSREHSVTERLKSLKDEFMRRSLDLPTI
jgi:hypothetical protein